MDISKYDLIVLGGGPAGYVASIRSAQLGLKTACIERRKTLGGTCLNVGCIPSKALLESSEIYHQARTKFSRHGISIGEAGLDIAQMMKRKDAVVRQLSNGIAALFRKHKIDWICGEGRIRSLTADEKILDINSDSGTRTVAAPNLLLATGSEAASLPFLPFDGKRVISSTEALSLPSVPRHLIVIGAGAIGLELGSVWLRLGAKVTVIEYLDKIGGSADRQISIELYKSLLKQGMEFKLSSKCTGATASDCGIKLECEEMPSGNKLSLEGDCVLVAAGRRPNTKDLGLEQFGIHPDARGFIPVDDRFETSIKGVYAVGDIIRGPMLAHKAEEEGVAAIEAIAGMTSHINYGAIPAIIYTWPELASVGVTEEELRKDGVEIRTGVFPFMANGRARSMDETEGMAKIIVDAKNDTVLGIHIVGPRAGDMIAEAVTVLENKMTSERVARMTHAHPTLSEALKEAALAVHGRTLHV